MKTSLLRRFFEFVSQKQTPQVSAEPAIPLQILGMVPYLQIDFDRFKDLTPDSNGGVFESTIGYEVEKAIPCVVLSFTYRYPALEKIGYRALTSKDAWEHKMTKVELDRRVQSLFINIKKEAGELRFEILDTSKKVMSIKTTGSLEVARDAISEYVIRFSPETFVAMVDGLKKGKAQREPREDELAKKSSEGVVVPLNLPQPDKP